MIWCSKIQPVSGSERLDLTSLMNMMGSCNAMEWLHIIARINRDQDVGHVVHVLFFLAVWLSEQLVEICGTSLVLRLPRGMHLCRSSSKVPRLPRFLKLLQRPHVLITLDKGQKFGLARNCIWLSKIGSGPSVFNTFDVETCFAPQQRPLFNISKVLWGGHFFSTVDWICASHHNFVHFSTSQLPKVLRDRRLIWKRASRRCAFWTSQLPTVVRHWCVLYILTSTCDLRQNGVHLSTS